MGPLIRHKEVLRVDQWVREALEGGAQLLCGGRALSESCYAPTVLLDPPADCKLSRLEVFGPVVCVYTYDALARRGDWARQRAAGGVPSSDLYPRLWHGHASLHPPGRLCRDAQ